MWITTLFARTVHISGRWNFSPISYLSLSFPFERVGCLGKLGADEGEGQQSFNSVSFVLSILNSRMEDTGNQCLRTTFLNHLPLINMYHKDMMKVNIFVFMCSRYHIIFWFIFGVRWSLKFCSHNISKTCLKTLHLQLNYFVNNRGVYQIIPG